MLQRLALAHGLLHGSLARSLFADGHAVARSQSTRAKFAGFDLALIARMPSVDAFVDGLGGVVGRVGRVQDGQRRRTAL